MLALPFGKMIELAGGIVTLLDGYMLKISPPQSREGILIVLGGTKPLKLFIRELSYVIPAVNGMNSRLSMNIIDDNPILGRHPVREMLTNRQKDTTLGLNMGHENVPESVKPRKLCRNVSVWP